MDRDEARRRIREMLPAEPTTSLVFRHPDSEQPLPAGDLAAIITRLRADLGVNVPPPVATPSHLARLERITPAEALAIADCLRVHFDGFERRQGQSLLQPGDGRPTSVPDLGYHLKLVGWYQAAERFFAAVAASDVPALLK